MPIQWPVLDAANDLESVLIPEQKLADRVVELGAQISRDYAGRKIILVSVLKGGMIFLADLMRCINAEHEIELIGASSYKGGTAPASGNIRITKDVDQNLAGKHVILVEDIFDSGRTMRVAYDLIKLHGPASLEICALVVKRREGQDPLPVKYSGFEIDDVFVVGYGLDYQERYRNLPCIGILKKDLYS